MKRADKITKRKENSIKRAKKNGRRNKGRSSWRTMGNRLGFDCPFDVEMNNTYGTCTCGGVNYNDCCGDI